MSQPLRVHPSAAATAAFVVFIFVVHPSLSVSECARKLKTGPGQHQRQEQQQQQQLHSVSSCRIDRRVRRTDQGRWRRNTRAKIASCSPTLITGAYRKGCGPCATSGCNPSPICSLTGARFTYTLCRQ